MSFVNKMKSTRRQVKRRREKPDWDPTVNDLSALKATPEDIERRQESFRSKNLELVRKQALERRIASACRQTVTDSNNRSHHSNAFLREILYNESDSSRLMEDTRKALLVAQDLFGDDMTKYRAIPTITALDSDHEANHFADRSLAADGLIKRANDQPTRLEKLSDSVVRKVALNETFSASDLSSSDEDDGKDPVHDSFLGGRQIINNTPQPEYPERLDLQRFQRLLEEEEDLSTIKSEQNHEPVPLNVVDPPVPRNIGDQTLQKETMGTKKSGVTKICSRNSTNDVRPSDLMKHVYELEGMMKAYEKTHEIVGNNVHPETFTSYTVSLISCLERVMRYFNQVHDKLAKEKRITLSLSQELAKQKNLVDALTMDSIKTQEQFCLLLESFSEMKHEMSTEIKVLKEMVEKTPYEEAVHTVVLDKANRHNQPNSSGGLHRTPSTTTVKVHPEFLSSPEQARSISQVPVDGELNYQPSSSQNLVEAFQQPSSTGTLKESSIALESPLSLESQIERLRADHQEALARFQKLCEARSEMQKGSALS